MLVVTDTVSGRDGTDQISGVEFLKFKDQIIFIENADSANIARLYSAALGPQHLRSAAPSAVPLMPSRSAAMASRLTTPAALSTRTGTRSS